MSKIIIEIEGGLVQAVWSTDKTITVEIMDRDIPENEEDAEEYIQEIAKLEAEIQEPEHGGHIMKGVIYGLYTGIESEAQLHLETGCLGTG